MILDTVNKKVNEVSHSRFRVINIENLNTELSLTDRTYVCETCGMVKNRDLNAAINLKKGGLTPNQQMPVDLSACEHAQAGMTALFRLPQRNEATSMDETGSENVDKKLHLFTFCRAATQ